MQTASGETVGHIPCHSHISVNERIVLGFKALGKTAVAHGPKSPESLTGKLRELPAGPTWCYGRGCLTTKCQLPATLTEDLGRNQDVQSFMTGAVHRKQRSLSKRGPWPQEWQLTIRLLFSVFPETSTYHMDILFR